MAKFYGVVGYGITEENGPGVYIDQVVEWPYYGDVIHQVKHAENGIGIVDNLRLNEQISIVADAFAYQHFSSIKYVTYMGVKWKVTAVEVQHPRLILSFGGVFNAEST